MLVFGKYTKLVLCVRLKIRELFYQGVSRYNHCVNI